MDEVSEGTAKSPRLVNILLGLFLLGALIALSIWLWLGRQPATAGLTGAPPATVSASAAAPTPQSRPAGQTDTPGDGFGLIVGPATPWAVAGGLGEVTATATATPVDPAATPVTITLLGPPARSVFRVEDVVSFYWSAPADLAAGQRFVVYLITDEGRAPIGTADAANLGQGYQLRAEVGRIAGEAGAYHWQIVLEDAASTRIIGQSEARQLTLVGAGN